MRTEVKMWREFYAELGQVSLVCPAENKVIKKTMASSQEYKERAKAIIRILGIQYSILEIGCGYGGLAEEILKEKEVRYTCVDNEAMLNQARRFLEDRVIYIDAKEIRTLKGKKFDLFISHYCLSETPLQFREYVLQNIIKNCKKVSVIDINDGVDPTRTMIKAGYEIVPLNIEKWLRQYFDILKICTGKNQSMYLGERLE